MRPSRRPRVALPQKTKPSRPGGVAARAGGFKRVNGQQAQTRLEVELHAELDLTRGTVGASDLPEGLARDAGVGIGEVGGVPHVVQLSSELQLEALAQREALERRKVKIVQARAAQDVTARIAEAGSPRCESGLQSGAVEAACIEPFGDSLGTVAEASPVR